MKDNKGNKKRFNALFDQYNTDRKLNWEILKAMIDDDELESNMESDNFFSVDLEASWKQLLNRLDDDKQEELKGYEWENSIQNENVDFLFLNFNLN